MISHEKDSTFVDRGCRGHQQGSGIAFRENPVSLNFRIVFGFSSGDFDIDLKAFRRKTNMISLFYYLLGRDFRFSRRK